MRSILFLFVVNALLISCGGQSTTKESPAKQENSEESSASSQQLSKPMDIESLKKLIPPGVDQIDFTFDYLPFSMNYSDINGIHTALSHIGLQAVLKNPNCNRRMAEIYFFANGEYVYTADMYYDGANCNYFVFKKNGKTVFANMMNEKGKKYYANLMAKMKTGNFE